MSNAVVLYAVAATVISVMIGILLLVLLIQRRRHRATVLMAIAHEQAEHRRRKRKKAGLRRWEIDMACPEVLVSDIASHIDLPRIHSAAEHPRVYAAALYELHAAGSLPRVPAASPSAAVLAAASGSTPIMPPVPPPAAAAPDPDDIDAGGLCDPAHALADESPLPQAVISIPADGNTCVVCLDDLVAGDIARALPCQHVYHSQCIRLWLRRRNACPCCAEKVVKRRPRRSEVRVSDLPPEQNAHALTEPSAPSSAAQTVTHASSSDAAGCFAPRLQDRTEPVSLDMPSRHASKSVVARAAALSCGLPSVQPPLLSHHPLHSHPEVNDDASSDPGNSELSSMHDADEPTAAELLYQLRTALRCEPSMRSCSTSFTTDWSDCPVSERNDLFEPFVLPMLPDVAVASTPDIEHNR